MPDDLAQSVASLSSLRDEINEALGEKKEEAVPERSAKPDKPTLDEVFGKAKK